MRLDFATILLTLGAGISLVAAAPAEGLAKRQLEGECNGTSCYYHLINYECSGGTSCKKDGEKCTAPSEDDPTFTCPVKI